MSEEGLSLIHDELIKIRRALEQIAGNSKPKPLAKEPDVSPNQPLTVKQVEGSFPQHLRGLLQFMDRPDATYIVVKPLKYLGSDKFAQIAEVVKTLKGKYVSAKADSHFRIPK